MMQALDSLIDTFLHSHWSIFVLWLASFAGSYLLVPRVIAWYRRHRWDKPHTGHRQGIKDTHHGQIPRGGGIAIYVGLLAGLICLAILTMLSFHDFTTFFDALIKTHYVPVLLAALLLALIGWQDDIRDLSPWPRMLINIIAAVIVIRVGIQIEFVTNPVGGVFDLTFWSWLPAILTVFYIVALTNIVNWSKGIDGQMPGTVALAAAWVGILAMRSGSYITAVPLAFIVSGAFAGFLIWNFYPQKIMPGYGGGSLAGFLLAVISIMAGAKIATLFMVLALPIADAIFTIMRRTIAGKSIFLGDRGHLHHKLLDRLHWGRRRIACFYWLVTLFMGMLASVLPTWGKITAFLLVVGLVFVFLIYMKLSSHKSQKVV